MVERAGTAVAGFEVAGDRDLKLVRASMWGLWTSPVFRPYRTALVRELDPFRALECAVLLDASAWPPQRPEAQRAIIEAWAATAVYRVRIRILKVDNSVTRIQLCRLLSEAGLHDSVIAKNSAEAYALLRDAPARRVGR